MTKLNVDLPVIIAAHPADELGPPAAALLEAAAGGRARVVCVNPRGEESVEQMADEIDEARRRAGLGSVFFWGMSGGGWLGLALAHRHPTAVRGLIIESCCASLRDRVEDPACVLSPRNPAWRATLEPLGLIPGPAHTVAHDAGTAAIWEDVAGFGAVLRSPGGPALLVAPIPLSPRTRAVMPALLAFDARPWLRTLGVPAAVMCGSADPLVPLAHARALADGLGTPLVTIDGAGHVPVTEGRPEVGPVVQQLLARP